MSDQKRSTYSGVDLSKVKTYSMSDLERKVQQGEFARPMPLGGTLADFVDSLPNILAAKDLREFAALIADAKRGNKTVILIFGGHVIKTGLAPLLIDWMERGIVTALATHGAGVIHDTEIALFGRTSEDVAEGLSDGSFGMCRDTADFINNAITESQHHNITTSRNQGYGEALGQALIKAKAPSGDLSLTYAAHRLHIPLTVHVAFGTDIIHQHPSADGAAIGKASMHDFRIFAREVGRLEEGAVLINLGSAVIMPEVFLKALSIARNLGYPAHKFTTANFDMISHYRPIMNVLNRPTLTSGRKFNFIGHNEIMVPLLHGLVLNELAS